MKRGSRPQDATGAQAGMSLAEILVAMTVFVIAAAVALILYNGLTRSYELGDNATEMQQNTRAAFDRLVSDLRKAGFNYNPDGFARPDEQFEGAWDTAVAIRGDFDFEDPAASTVPEVALAGGAFAAISTGNDEIVTYALAKPDGTGGTSAALVADVLGVPRDGTTETITITNLALVQDDPPYTLYRITVNPNSTQ
ncbi:MAG: prepilin-type N-terminal cleavage/methylation domain-containing protein, partial [Longimicrobiales bacterium]